MDEIQLRKEFEFFAHVTSHDLRDPLRQALAVLENLTATLETIDNESVTSKDTTEISALINEVIQKIASLKEYSRLLNDSTARSLVNLNQVAHEIIAEYQTVLDMSKAKVNIANLPTLNVVSWQIKNLFSYLIENAIKFKRAGVDLLIDITATEKDGIWQFAIKDNAIGLDMLYHELVFVLFQKLEARNSGNLGAGLAFAKKIVENHGGKIWYENWQDSETEFGTIFYFTLN